MEPTTPNASERRSPKGPPDRGKAATQARILAAATELFIERGYEGTTIPEVAEGAGVSRATVFWHFSDKASLFREAFTRMLAPFRESLERDFDDLPPRKRLEELLAASEQFTREHRAEIAAFVSWAVTTPAFRETVLTTLLDLNQRFAGVLTQAMSELALPGRDSRLLAVALHLAFDANLLLAVWEGSERAEEERSAAIRELAALIADAAD